LEQDVKQLKDENKVLKTQIVKYQTTEKYHQDMMKKVALPPGMNHRAKLGIFGGVDENMEEEEEEEEEEGEEEREEEREYSQLYQDYGRKKNKMRPSLAMGLKAIEEYNLHKQEEEGEEEEEQQQQHQTAGKEIESTEGNDTASAEQTEINFDELMGMGNDGSEFNDVLGSVLGASPPKEENAFSNMLGDVLGEATTEEESATENTKESSPGSPGSSATAESTEKSKDNVQKETKLQIEVADERDTATGGTNCTTTPRHRAPPPVPKKPKIAAAVTSAVTSAATTETNHQAAPPLPSRKNSKPPPPPAKRKASNPPPPVPKKPSHVHASLHRKASAGKKVPGPPPGLHSHSSTYEGSKEKPPPPPHVHRKT